MQPVSATRGDDIMDHMPGVIDAVKRAYLDLRDVYEHLNSLVITAFLLTLAVTAIGFFLSGLGFALLSQLVRLAVHIAFGFVITPYLIAVHRLIILGEVTSRYDLEPGDPRFQRFFGWTVAFAVLSAAPAILLSIVPLPGFLRSLLGLALAIAVLVVTLRLIIVLPAVAVDSSHVTWQNAMADTDGYALRIFLIGLAASIPVAVVAVILAGLFGSFRFVLLELVATLILGAAGFVVASLLVVIASRIYEWLGDRVRA
jgi:hypothetical protein